MANVSPSELIDHLSRLSDQLADDQGLRIEIARAVELLAKMDEKGALPSSSPNAVLKIFDVVSSIEVKLEGREFSAKKLERRARIIAFITAVMTLFSSFTGALAVDISSFNSLRVLILLGGDVFPGLAVSAAVLSLIFLFMKIKRGNEYIELNKTTRALHLYMSNISGSISRPLKGSD